MKKTLSIEAVHHLYAGELGHAQAQVDNAAERFKAQYDEDEDFVSGGEGRKPYVIIDGIAVYKIFGPLLTNGSWWTRALGYSAYDDIRADLMQAAADPDVQDIMLFMGTPGGSVFGVTDASDALSKVAAIKPLYVYSAKNVASGGYWLAANATKLIGSPESEWGSVGVIVTHFSYEKQLEEDGIAVTVIKSDELKAVGGPYKNLTDKEISHIKAQVDEYNDLFQEHVRSKRPGVRLSSMKGETYIGDSALRMGLIDAVMSYDQTIEYIKSERKSTTQVGGYKMKMTAEELKVALEAGATLESLGLTEEEAAEITASAKEHQTDESGSDAQAGDEGVTKPEENGADLPGVEAMREQLVAAEASITDLTGRLEDATKKLEAAQADQALAGEMKEALAAIINGRRIAMRLPPLDFSAYSAQSLMFDYKAIAAQFDSAFKIGGIFKSGNKQTTKPTAATNSIHNSQLSAAA